MSDIATDRRYAGHTLAEIEAMPRAKRVAAAPHVVDALAARVRELEGALAALYAMSDPPFRLKPIGAPGSPQRTLHDAQIAAHDVARAALAAAGEGT